MINLNSYIEHTVLKQGITVNTIKDNLELCSAFSIPVLVIPPSMTARVKTLRSHYENIKVCTVIGFPLGYSTFETKIFEIKNALNNGADEIDLVIDNSLVKDNRWDDLRNEISGFKDACGNNILKIIVETSIINRAELDRIANILIGSRVDFIKTSTGFVGDGAKIEDIKYLKNFYGGKIKIKASGGIKTKEQAIEFIKAGADRIGTSSTKQILDK